MPVIERSALGIVVDGTNLGEGSEAVGRTLRYELNRRYDWL